MNMKNLDLTFVLGTASPSAVDMANAYATFAARGERARTTFVRKVVDSNGEVLYRHEPKTKRVFDKDVAEPSPTPSPKWSPTAPEPPPAI